jgi:hypothetical protein
MAGVSLNLIIRAFGPYAKPGAGKTARGARSRGGCGAGGLIRSTAMQNAKMAGKWWRRLGQAAGLALLVAAVLAAGAGIDWHVLQAGDISQLAIIASAVLGNLALTAILFWSITLCFDARPAVPLGRMFHLIALSSLLNYLPLLRAGLWSRAAYLKWRHELPLRQSLVILIVVLAIAAAVLGVVAASILLFAAKTAIAVALGALILLTATTGPVARRLLHRKIIWPQLWIPLRTCDMLLAAVRLYLAFTIIDQPISFTDALLAGAAAVVIKLTGLTPNGLGLSEWTVAAVASTLSPSLTIAAAAGAALIDRAMELVVVIAAGAIAACQIQREPANTS